MKNKYLCNFQKLLRAFLIFAMFATSSQIAAAQLNVALSNARLGTMIKQIKAQSKYQFFYDDNLASIPVHAVNLKNASLETVLDKALVVYLSKKETQTAVAQVAQQATHKVTGTVTDTTGEPLIGVSIQEVGTSNGAITDIDGNYTQNVSAPTAKLRFSYNG